MVIQSKAWEYPGAQLYPSCLQVAVSGSGSGQPTELVSFPGEYTADTPGVVFDVYQGDAEYPVSFSTASLFTFLLNLPLL